jgi:polyisoprenoid-binding protein YceI
MIKNVFVVTSLLISVLSAGAQVINTEKSVVRFSLSNMKWKTVEGSFKGMQGSVKFNPQELNKARFNVCIDVSTVNTENEKRDEHLKNEDFFEISKYPKICFVSTSVTRSGNDFLVVGKLTVKNVTKTVSIPFTYNKGVLAGNLEIKRLEYNVGEDTGTFMVGDEVSLTIVCETK